VAEWLARHSGRKTFEQIWLPLLKAKLGDTWQRTSAAFIWATIQRMYAARHTGHKQEMFGYLYGGYSRMLAVFRRRLEELGSKHEPAAEWKASSATKERSTLNRSHKNASRSTAS